MLLPPSSPFLWAPDWPAGVRTSSSHPDPVELHEPLRAPGSAFYLTEPPTHVQKFVLLSYYHRVSNSICYPLLAGTHKNMTE